MKPTSLSPVSGSPVPARRGTPSERNAFDEEPLLTVDDVAALLTVSKVWVYQRARTGELLSGKIGKHLRFRRADVLRFRDAAFDRAVAGA